EYRETELLIQGLLGVDREPLAPVRPEDAPGAMVEAPTEPVEGAHAGPYRAGGVWVRARGTGTVTADGEQFAVEGPASVELRSHARSTTGSIVIEPGPGVEVIGTVFTPGLAAAD
ncbi:MAG: DipZ protein, partial [Actinomycetes bacterium]